MTVFYARSQGIFLRIKRSLKRKKLQKKIKVVFLKGLTIEAMQEHQTRLECKYISYHLIR